MKPFSKRLESIDPFQWLMLNLEEILKQISAGVAVEFSHKVTVEENRSEAVMRCIREEWMEGTKNYPITYKGCQTYLVGHYFKYGYLSMYKEAKIIFSENDRLVNAFLDLGL